MFCPNCEDEFRAGFERCGKCNVDLVDRLAEDEGDRPAPIPEVVQMMDYCGFFSMAEAEEARQVLRGSRIRSEILIREPLDVDWEAPPSDEFWIRVERNRIREAQVILGELEAARQEQQGTFACSDCGFDVAAEESFCPKCGARFDD